LQAADELHLAQPGVTAQIRSLEESAGIALFDHIDQDAILEPVGATLLQYARKIYTIANELMILIVSFCIWR